LDNAGPFIDTVILDRFSETWRSWVADPLESSRVYTYIPEDLTVGEKEMLETAAGSSAPLTCAYRVGTGIYIDIRDSWRPPNKLLIFSPFAYTIIRHPGAHISGLKFRVYMAGHD
jgi:hypothetical protein